MDKRESLNYLTLIVNLDDFVNPLTFNLAIKVVLVDQGIGEPVSIIETSVNVIVAVVTSPAFGSLQELTSNS